MSALSSVNPKANSLMNLFLKRQPQHSLPNKKPTKRVKPNQDKQLDPLTQILSWRDDMRLPPTPQTASSKIVCEQNLVAANPENWGTNLQGIFINVDWNQTSMEAFKNMTLSNDLLSNGMVFVWGSKTNIGQLLDHFESMGYVYAENFMFVLLDRSKIPARSQKKLSGNTSLLNFFTRVPPTQNQNTSNIPKPSSTTKADYQVGRVEDPSQIFLNSQSQYFGGSQRILYMFRKINKKQPLQLRHQRTSDVYFTIGENEQLDWKAKEVVYKMIETLLINANYKEGEQLKLMEIWASSDYSRKGWIMVNEQTQEKKENTTSQISQQ